MYELKIDRQAAKYLKRLMEGLMKLAENPFTDANMMRLKGYSSTFRKRVGDFWIIFEVDQGDLIVLVLKIGSRGDIYKK